MLALGLVLNTAAIGLFCWLIFTLAVHALPLFVAISVGTMAYHAGAGLFAATLLAIVFGALTIPAGQTALAVARPPILRAAITAAFVIPAGFAGFHIVLVMSQIGISSMAWREIVACLGAVFVGGTAWTRLTSYGAPAVEIGEDFGTYPAAHGLPRARDNP
ncbi:hypothetical protein IVA79_31520 [Bradyrhizobium sp. 138]|uniref:hypothetical protein n=1 Tax=Bradyrhizobium sp. 138 TaxID=2782615 RepID=UPI001FFA6611|nr:hypothetical protein [Bradyrhizobium sp. 138]MCK1738387.1 hypothetical protein [Bradyrhizobium sp. 138]